MADIIARFKRLAGYETHFLMGNDEYSLERLQEGGRARYFPARLLRPHGAGVPFGLEEARHLVRRFHPHDGGPPPRFGAGSRPENSRRGGRLRADVRGLVLRLLRGFQAGERSRRGKLSPSPDETALARGEEPFLPPLALPRTSPFHLPGEPGLSRTRGPPERDS